MPRPSSLAALAPIVPRGGWRRRLAGTLATQLTLGLTPEKLALSAAVGALCAFFPVLGLATPLCVLAGIALGLNQPILQLVNGATAPLYPLGVWGLVRLGDLVLGPGAPWDPSALAALLRHDPGRFLQGFAPLAGHGLLGWALVAPGWIALSYPTALLAVRAARRGRPLPLFPTP